MKNKVAVIIILFLVICATGFSIPSHYVRIVIEVDGQIACDAMFKENGNIFFNRRKEAQRLIDKGYDDMQIIACLFVGLNDSIAKLEEKYYIPSVSANATFKLDEKARFIYTAERSGRRLNSQRLRKDIISGIRSNEIVVSATLEEVLPSKTLEEITQETSLRGRFETKYQSSSPSRKHNIKRAAELICGYVLQPQEKFSFNTVVGERTLDRGFLEALIIFDGKFVSGVGGGVCQVSTTLYNSVLYAGLSVLEVSQHSLPVSYVAPSFDAMVSSRSDLVFVNDTDCPVYLYACANGEKLIFEVYGKKQKNIIELQSQTLRSIPYITEVVQDGEVNVGETKIVRAGREGLESVGYLYELTPDGKVVSKKKIRHDVYAPQTQVIAEGSKAEAINLGDTDKEAS